MSREARAEAQHRALTLFLPQAKLSIEQLWARYFALTGHVGMVELEAYLNGMMPLESLERDILAHALNERLDELDWPPRVPYSRDESNAVTGVGALAALAAVLDAAHLAPPERLPEIADEAAAALGVERIEMYLVNYEQTQLVPLRTRSSSPLAPLSIENSLAGRAFQLVQTMPSEGARPSLWVPLVDGAERFGVLEVSLADRKDLVDPGLRAQCRWLSHLLGHVVLSADGFGDAITACRSTTQRSVAAELLWNLLPPLTGGLDGFVLAGVVEPAYQTGGDAFDYALSETTVSMAIFDAMGHDLDAALMAAVALSAYRAARKAGDNLVRQARAIDTHIAAQFPGSFCTGIVAELDLRTGQLQYLSAGHPSPLVFRSGKVVRTLGAARRFPFGLGALDDAPEVVAQEVLQPGDWLILHTDGVTEARSADGTFFGEQRLVDLLTREAAAGHPPPETARRLTQAVLAHQHGVLQDDATVLLASWHPTSDAHPER